MIKKSKFKHRGKYTGFKLKFSVFFRFCIKIISNIDTNIIFRVCIN